MNCSPVCSALDFRLIPLRAPQRTVTGDDGEPEHGFEIITHTVSGSQSNMLLLNSE